MKGTTYKRKLPSGRTTWCLGIDVGKDETGKRKGIFKSGFRLEDDADNVRILGSQHTFVMRIAILKGEAAQAFWAAGPYKWNFGTKTVPGSNN
jgi:hypothetical protein